MDNHQEENNHAGAQSRAEGANLTDVLDAARFRWLIDQHTSIDSTGDENEYANCHIEYFCADTEDDRAQSIRRMIDWEMNKASNA